MTQMIYGEDVKLDLEQGSQPLKLMTALSVIG